MDDELFEGRSNSGLTSPNVQPRLFFKGPLCRNFQNLALELSIIRVCREAIGFKKIIAEGPPDITETVLNHQTQRIVGIVHHLGGKTAVLTERPSRDAHVSRGERIGKKMEPKRR